MLPDGTPAVVILIAYNGPLDDGERLLHPLRECAPLLADQVGSLPYTALQSMVTVVAVAFVYAVTAATAGLIF